MAQRAVAGIYFSVAQSISYLTGSRLVLTPSMLVIGTGLQR
jgi:hypothetical protein